MIIVYAMTRNLYPHFVAPLKSLYAHNKPYKVYILAEDDSLPYALPYECEVVNVSGQTYFPPNNPNARSIFTYMAMMRACYTDLLPNEEKVLQLDIDTVVCDDLTPLWDTDIEGKWFAACPEYLGRYNPWDKPKYYNIGVCLYNLKQMRKDNAMQKMVDLMNSRQMGCVEQDALNYFGVPDKCVDIPVRYNESFCCGETDNPAIVHYAGWPDWYKNQALPRRVYLDKYR